MGGTQQDHFLHLPKGVDNFKLHLALLDASIAASCLMTDSIHWFVTFSVAYLGAKPLRNGMYLHRGHTSNDERLPAAGKPLMLGQRYARSQRGGSQAAKPRILEDGKTFNSEHTLTKKSERLHYFEDCKTFNSEHTLTKRSERLHCFSVKL